MSYKAVWFTLVMIAVSSLLVVPVHAGQSRISLEKFQGDFQFDALASIVNESDCIFDDQRLAVKETPIGQMILIPVVHINGEDKGVLTVIGGKWRLSLTSKGKVHAYEAVRDDDGRMTVIERDVLPEGVESKLREQNRRVDQFIASASMTGINWCLYTSKVGISYACVAWEDNPFGYYHVQTYRQGATITWNHYAWYADYKGRAIACPLNEEKWSPFKWVECGFPPD